MKTLKNIFGLGAVSAIALCGCKTEDEHHEHHEHSHTAKGAMAVAELNPTASNNVRGKVTFTQVKNGVKVIADITGLTPGVHGFHIHEKGDCSAPDGSSAGGHFNPAGMPHGGPNAAQRHSGDFGNVTADESGKAHVSFVDAHLSFEGTNSIVGRGVIVHAKPDDLTTQPSGNAGARVACGVIEKK